MYFDFRKNDVLFYLYSFVSMEVYAQRFVEAYINSLQIEDI